MKHDTITRIFICQLHELGALKEYLEQMARQGWLLERINGNRYYFRKGEPKKLFYSVEVFGEASDLDLYPGVKNEEYIEYCRAAGWRFVCSEGKKQVFCTEKEDIAPIESDQALKLQTIHKSMMKQNFISWFILPVIGLWIVSMQLSTGVINIFRSYLSCSVILLWLLLLGLTAYSLIDYFAWYRKSKKRVLRGDDIVYRGRIQRNAKLLFPLIISVLWVVAGFVIELAYNNVSWWFWLLMAGMISIVLVVSFMAKYLIRKIGAPTVQNRLVVIAASVVVSLVIMQSIFFFVVIGVFDKGHENAERIVTKSGNSVTVTTIYHDDLPLTLHDLGVVTSERYSSCFKNWGHFLINNDYGYQITINDSPEPYLSYDIYQTNIPWLYNKILEELLFRYPQHHNYEQIDAEGFKANAVYRDVYVEDDSEFFSYIIMYDAKIINLGVNFELAVEQMAVVCAKLSS